MDLYGKWLCKYVFCHYLKSLPVVFISGYIIPGTQLPNGRAHLLGTA